jgi:hypothetical protein
MRGVYSGYSGLSFLTSAKLAIQMGSASFGWGPGGFQTVFHKGITSAQVQLSSKEIGPDMFTRNFGITWATGSYQTTSESATIAAGAATLTHTPYSSIMRVMGMVNYKWVQFIRVTGVPNSGEYSITGSALTFNTSDNGIILTIEYCWNNTTAGQRGQLPLGFIPAPITGSFQVLSGDKTSDGKDIWYDWYFENLQPMTERIDVGATWDNFNDDYTELYNVNPNSLLCCSEWQEE